MAQLLRARTAHRAPTSEPNVIPFIDVLLVLLIIFMVTAPSPTTDINVDLPNGAPRIAVIEPTIVDIRADLDGFSLRVDEEPVELAELARTTLGHALRNNPGIATEQIYAEARIFVRADQSTAYGNVVMVMNELQEARFAQVGIFAETAQES